MQSLDRRNRATVSVLLADGDSLTRQALGNALVHEGYRDIRTFGRISELRDIVASTLPDLLVIDTDMPDGDAIALVTEMRNGHLGRNPFPPVIFTTWDAGSDVVRSAVDSGADLILAKPVSPVRLFTRIDSLVAQRKPFVVTADYMGPDRREEPGPGDENLFDVPNTLKDKVEGRPIDLVELFARINAAIRDMNESRLQQVSVQLACQVEVLSRDFAERKITKSTKVQLVDIIRSAEDISVRVNGTEFGELAGLCDSLLKVARTVHRRPRRADPKQVDLLRPLSQSILLSANPDLNCRLPADQISQMVSTYSMRRRSAPLPAG